jgi:hypothetical protein
MFKINYCRAVRVLLAYSETRFGVPSPAFASSQAPLPPPGRSLASPVLPLLRTPSWPYFGSTPDRTERLAWACTGWKCTRTASMSNMARYVRRTSRVAAECYSSGGADAFYMDVGVRLYVSGRLSGRVCREGQHDCRPAIRIQSHRLVGPMR